MTEQLKPSVVLVDDDTFWARGTLVALRERLEVTYINSADQAVVYFEDKYDIDGIILDIMMPPPAQYEAETEEGFLTGVWVLETLQALVVSQKIAVLVLTNHHDIDTVKKAVSALGIPKKLLTVQTKFGTSRRELAALLEARILAAKSIG